MKHITTRQFSVLVDCGKIYQFMLDIYERDWRNGVPAPFFEYAFSSFAYWMDIILASKKICQIIMLQFRPAYLWL